MNMNGAKTDFLRGYGEFCIEFVVKILTVLDHYGSVKAKVILLICSLRLNSGRTGK